MRRHRLHSRGLISSLREGCSEATRAPVRAVAEPARGSGMGMFFAMRVLNKHCSQVVIAATVAGSQRHASVVHAYRGRNPLSASTGRKGRPLTATVVFAVGHCGVHWGAVSRERHIDGGHSRTHGARQGLVVNVEELLRGNVADSTADIYLQSKGWVRSAGGQYQQGSGAGEGRLPRLASKVTSRKVKLRNECMVDEEHGSHKELSDART